MINGAQTDLIPVRDRGLQYGDGCFETVRICARTPLLLERHLHRLQATCELMRLEFNAALLLKELAIFFELCPPDGILKIILTRGIGGRGYAATEGVQSNRILMYALFPDDYTTKAETGVNIEISPFRLSQNAFLAGIKHLNRLDQVLASFALGEGVDEVICLDQDDHVIEGTKSNLFLVIDGRVITPELTAAGVRGVMRDYLIQRFRNASMSVESRIVTQPDLLLASELFLCNSVFGVWPVRKLTENANVHTWPTGPLTRLAKQYHNDLLDAAIQATI